MEGRRRKYVKGLRDKRHMRARYTSWLREESTGMCPCLGQLARPRHAPVGWNAAAERTTKPVFRLGSIIRAGWVTTLHVSGWGAASALGTTHLTVVSRHAAAAAATAKARVWRAILDGRAGCRVTHESERVNLLHSSRRRHVRCSPAPQTTVVREKCSTSGVLCRGGAGMDEKYAIRQIAAFILSFVRKNTFFAPKSAAPG
jgi:hypothetical protein